MELEIKMAKTHLVDKHNEQLNVQIAGINWVHEPNALGSTIHWVSV